MELNKIFKDDWRLAGSGVSVQAGPIRVRMESAGTMEERQAIAKAICQLPMMVAIIEKLAVGEVTVGNVPYICERAREVWKGLKA